MLLATTFAIAQTVLTEKSHGLLPGNPNPMIITQFDNPGPAGENITWDFSALPQVAPFRGNVVEAAPINTTPEFAQANTCLVEDELYAFMRTSQQQLSVLGLRIDQNTMVRTYDTPVVKMRYPFAYGDMLSGSTTGTQRYSNGYSLPITLDYDVVADAYGTLILPGTTLHNALRVATIQIVRYGNAANATPSTVITYRWYVASHRFPVLSLIFERDANGKLIPLKGAYNPIVELPAVQITQETTLEGAKTGQPASLDARPNPFTSSLTVRYSLTGPANVTIALYDIRGALATTLHQGAHPEGSYEQTFADRIQQLPAGQYILRVEASGAVLTQQLVKIN